MEKHHKHLLIWSACITVIIGIVAFGGYHYYRLMYNNIQSTDSEQHNLYIYPGTTIDSMLSSLEQSYSVASRRTFRQHSKWLKFNYPEPGHYTIPASCGNYELINMLKYGKQTPISITFNNIRTVNQLVSKLSAQLLTDSCSIDSLLRDSVFLASCNLTQETAMIYFLPNTYNVYWTIKPEQLFDRMHHEYDNFWNKNRKQKAEKIELTPTEVSILASIVEEENSSHPDEWRRIAGLYLNRLKIGMPLQADPTIKYAIGDFAIKRVLNVHLSIESPYNTYQNRGLPPGPIRMPSASAIDAVLNAEKHNFLYMCADYNMNGYHRFATNSAEHARNARLYQNELNKRRIYK